MHLNVWVSEREIDTEWEERQRETERDRERERAREKCSGYRAIWYWCLKYFIFMGKNFQVTDFLRSMFPMVALGWSQSYLGLVSWLFVNFETNCVLALNI